MFRHPSHRAVVAAASGLVLVAIASGPSAALAPDPATSPSPVLSPTHTVTLGLTGDTWVSSLGQTTSQSTSPELRVGSNNLGLSKSRTYLTFDYSPLAALPAGAVIDSAKLTLSDFVTGSCKGTAIRVSRITSSWDLAGLKWSAQPTTTTTGSGTSTAAFGASGCPTETPVSFDATGIVRDWKAGAAEQGIQVKADNEGASTGYRKYRSAENGDAAKAPTLSVTYDTPPDKPTNVKVSPGYPNYASSLTPTFDATVSDPDGDAVQGYFAVYQGTTAQSPIVWTGYSDTVRSGDTASVTVPSGVLHDGTVYSVLVWGYDGALKSGTPAGAAFLVDVTAPSTAISSDVYADGQWVASTPGATTFTFDGSPDTGAFYINLDGAQYTVGSNASGGDYVISFTPTPGWHVIKASAIDRAGNVGPEQTFTFGAGSPAFVVPTEWQNSTADFPIEATAPPGATGATLLWRVNGETTWHTATQVSIGDTAWDGSVSNADGHASTGRLTWHATQEPFGSGTLQAPALLQIRGCFQYATTPTVCTADRYVGLSSP